MFCLILNLEVLVFNNTYLHCSVLYFSIALISYYCKNIKQKTFLRSVIYIASFVISFIKTRKVRFYLMCLMRHDTSIF